jgi:hydroxymethylglutaryl-CoA reductase
MAAVGLAQNLSAIRALSSEGIQRGHMMLHARNIAVMAGAKGDETDTVAKKIAEEGSITIERAKQTLTSLHYK